MTDEKRKGEQMVKAELKCWGLWSRFQMCFLSLEEATHSHLIMEKGAAQQGGFGLYIQYQSLNTLYSYQASRAHHSDTSCLSATMSWQRWAWDRLWVTYGQQKGKTRSRIINENKNTHRRKNYRVSPLNTNRQYSGQFSFTSTWPLLINMVNSE